MTERECNHDWELAPWGVIIGVSKCKRCGKIAQSSDFPALQRKRATSASRDDSPSYRNAMIKSGRGHLLR